MREPYKKEFFKYYNDAFKFYVKGDWVQAKELFEKTLSFAHNPEKEPVT